MIFKKTVFILIFLFSFMIFSRAQDIPPIVKSERIEEISGAKFYIHIVKKDQTLYSLAKAYEVNVDEIVTANPGSGSAIKIGQLLKIPYKEKAIDYKPSILTGDYKIHRVLKQETLYGISKKYGVEVEEIKAANPDLGSYLNEGQYLRIPEKPTATKEEIIPSEPIDTNFYLHKVKKKQTIYGIARLYGVTQEDLFRHNQGIEEGLKKGQILKIPIKMRLGEALRVDTSDISDIISKTFESQKTPYNCNLPVSGSVYNIALLMPFYLNGCDTIEISNPMRIKRPDEYPSFRFIQFYEGFLLAMDTIIRSGLSMRLHVYDVDENIESANTLLRSGVLNNMDLIIGPFYTNCFKLVAENLKDENIKLVNPFSNKQEIVKERPNVFKLIPGLQNQFDDLVSYLNDSFADANIVIITTNNEKEKLYAEMLKLSFIPDSLQKVLDYKELMCPQNGLGSLLSLLERGKKNVLITLSNSDVFVLNFIRGLKNLPEEYKIVLFGMPSWTKNSNIETKFLIKLKFHSFLPSLINYNAENVKNFIKRFRHEYETDPILESYAFHGYDIGYYFLNAIRQYGKEFDECIDQIRYDLLTTSFKFKKSPEDGFENTYVNIFMYDGYQVKDARKEDVK
ncbi:LysM peptidoglycan-binding domain-containing protein [Bacteroidota bacterium]